MDDDNCKHNPLGQYRKKTLDMHFLCLPPPPPPPPPPTGTDLSMPQSQWTNFYFCSIPPGQASVISSSGNLAPQDKHLNDHPLGTYSQLPPPPPTWTPFIVIHMGVRLNVGIAQCLCSCTSTYTKLLLCLTVTGYGKTNKLSH